MQLHHFLPSPPQPSIATLCPSLDCRVATTAHQVHPGSRLPREPRAPASPGPRRRQSSSSRDGQGSRAAAAGGVAPGFVGQGGLRRRRRLLPPAGEPLLVHAASQHPCIQWLDTLGTRAHHALFDSQPVAPWPAVPPGPRGPHHPHCAPPPLQHDLYDALFYVRILLAALLGTGFGFVGAQGLMVFLL